MEDNRTDPAKYVEWLSYAQRAWADFGWKCEKGWIFIAPSGTRHDLSCVDIRKLPYVEQEGLFRVAE